MFAEADDLFLPLFPPLQLENLIPTTACVVAASIQKMLHVYEVQGASGEAKEIENHRNSNHQRSIGLTTKVCQLFGKCSSQDSTGIHHTKLRIHQRQALFPPTFLSDSDFFRDFVVWLSKTTWHRCTVSTQSIAHII